MSQEDLDKLKNEMASENEVEGSSSDHGSNSTGWVRQPDGTMIHKSSSWASWSKTSSSEDSVSRDELDKVQNDLRERVRSHLDQENLPPNVEPGFEGEYQRRYKEHNTNGVHHRYETKVYLTIQIFMIYFN